MPRNYNQLTIKRLYGRAGNECAFPGCSQVMVNENNAKDSNICHIEAAKLGGERYRALMSNKERAAYENLILLCVQHHDETNDIVKYTVDVLKQMKSNHESDQLSKKLSTNPSMLKNIIAAIADIEIDDEEQKETLNAFDISSKLNFNSVKRNVPLIQEFKVYHHKIDSLYSELEKQGSLKKNKILLTIRTLYLKAKGTYIGDLDEPIDEIRNHADDIIDDVRNELQSHLTSSGLFEEDIALGVDVILVDAFIRCKILEEPV